LTQRFFAFAHRSAVDKGSARLIISLDIFEELNMTYPKTNAKCRRELQAIRDQLAK
jgi:hypothetical protein